MLLLAHCDTQNDTNMIKVAYAILLSKPSIQSS